MTCHVKTYVVLYCHDLSIYTGVEPILDITEFHNSSLCISLQCLQVKIDHLLKGCILTMNSRLRDLKCCSLRPWRVWAKPDSDVFKMNIPSLTLLEFWCFICLLHVFFFLSVFCLFILLSLQILAFLFYWAVSLKHFVKWISKVLYDSDQEKAVSSSHDFRSWTSIKRCYL